METQERREQRLATIACKGCGAKLGEARLYQVGTDIYKCAERLKTGACGGE